MANLTRFGRKIALPSTRQIKHDLMALMTEEARRKDLAREKAAEGTVPVGVVEG